jgi:hypothetical protein
MELDENMSVPVLIEIMRNLISDHLLTRLLLLLI